MNRRLLPAWCIGLAVLPSLLCRGMVVGRLSDAEWFQQAKNKILILEYDTPLSSEWGKQLAELSSELLLTTVRGVESFAVITLRQEAQHVALTLQKIDELAKAQRTPVVVWGEFYRQGGNIYLVSHLRHVPAATGHDEPVGIAWDASNLGVPDPLQAHARSPTCQANFTPIRISQSSLEKLESYWNQSLVLKERPIENAAQSGGGRPEFPFLVLQTSNDWVELRTRDGSQGWMRANALLNAGDFKGLNAMVRYAQGLTQFVARNYSAAASTYRDYLEQYGSGQDVMNQAWAHVLLGCAYYLDKPGSTGDALDLALNEFEHAIQLLPNDASPVNCKAVAFFRKATASAVTAAEARQLEKQLIHVIQTENDLDAVANLQILYHLPNAAEYFKEGSADFGRMRDGKLEQLKSIERQLRKQ